MTTVGSLFSGIGGLDLGLERAGLGPVLWQVERSAWCRKVLGWHWPDVRSFVDVRSVGRSNLAPVDIVAGGFPCQDVSSAGRGTGLSGAKSGLWNEFRRVVEELAPPHVIVENVASGAKRWLPFVRRDLHLLGYRTRALSISAFDVGAPHKRERVFVLASKGPTAGAPTDANGEGVPRETWGERYQWRWSRDGNRWTIEPSLCGMAHGVPDSVHWLRALGNAVNVACAEVIGRVMVDEIRGAL